MGLGVLDKGSQLYLDRFPSLTKNILEQIRQFVNDGSDQEGGSYGWGYNVLCTFLVSQNYQNTRGHFPSV